MRPKDGRLVLFPGPWPRATVPPTNAALEAHLYLSIANEIVRFW
jgi:hypothetical protein